MGRITLNQGLGVFVAVVVLTTYVAESVGIPGVATNPSNVSALLFFAAAMLGAGGAVRAVAAYQQQSLNEPQQSQSPVQSDRNE